MVMTTEDEVRVIKVRECVYVEWECVFNATSFEALRKSNITIVMYYKPTAEVYLFR